MSSFVVGPDHIDYLVSAALRYTPRAPGVVDRDPDELGRFLLRENIEATAPGLLDSEEEDDLEPELGDVPDPEVTYYRAMLGEYTFRPVEDIDPAQAASVAACWQYQRGRESSSDFPQSWVIVEDIKTAALAAAPDSAFTDPHTPHTYDNLANRDNLAWLWTRPAP